MSITKSIKYAIFKKIIVAEFYLFPKQLFYVGGTVERSSPTIDAPFGL
jgi:hypothetical protein